MSVTIAQLRTLVSLARYGSFTRAAAALNRTQPAISAQIRQLESSLGLKLVDRTTRDVRLSAVGAEMVPVLAGVLSDLERVIDGARALKKYETGFISVGCLPSVASRYLPAKIAEFLRSYPGIRFQVHDGDEKRVVRMVEGGDVEIGITTQLSVTGLLKSEDLLEDPIVAIFVKGHPIEAVRRINVDELVKHDLILMGDGGGIRTIIDQAFANRRKMVVPRYEATYFTTALSMARAGLGVTLLPATIEPHDAKLRARRISVDGFSRKISIVTRMNRTLSPATQVFYDTLKTIRRDGRL